MRSFLSATIFAVLACAAHARLGETEGQSQLRYGQPREDLLGPQDKPLLEGSVEKQYLFEGFRVRAAFVEGRCVVIEYVHIPDEGKLKEFSEPEITAILAAESGMDERKVASQPKDKQQEMLARRWKEEKPKAPGALGDLEKGIKGAFKLRKWERPDGAVAEIALGLVIKVSDRSAESWAKKFAREGKKAAPASGGKAKPVVPKF